MKYRSEIDGLRSVAVLLVLLFHLEVDWFSGGYIGVDVFFVISGFLITSIITRKLDNNSFSFIEFYERRVRRIFPALYAVLLATFIFTTFYFMPNEYEKYSQSLVSSIIFFSNILFWLQSGYFDIASEFKPLLHTWSLAIEEQYYLLFPALMVILYKYCKRHVRIVLVVLFIFSFGFDVYYVAKKSTASFFLMHLRAWELLLGSLLALSVVPATNKRIVNELLAFLGLALVFLGGVCFEKGTNFPGWAALFPTLGTALIIYATGKVKYKNYVEKILNLKFMEFTGKISYSLYLWHWPLIVFYKYYFLKELHTIDKLVLGILSYVAAYIAWKFVEVPYRKYDFVLRNKKYLACTVVTSCFLLVLGLYPSIINRGFPQRLPESTVQYANAANDTNPDRSVCHSMKIEKIQNDDLCHLGDEAIPPKFIVWGDSFADAMMPGIKEKTLELGLHGLFASSSACGPTLGVNREVRQLQLACHDFNQEMVNAAIRHGITKVLLISGWGVSGYALVDGRENTEISIDGANYNQPGTKVFIYGFLSLIEELTNLGMDVYVVGKLPEPKFNVPTRLARYRVIGKPLEDLHIPYAKYAPVKSKISDILALADQKFNIHIIDTSGPLCSTQQCLVFEGQRVFYSDKSHLSATGSRFVMDAYQGFFSDIGM